MKKEENNLIEGLDLAQMTKDERKSLISYLASVSGSISPSQERAIKKCLLALSEITDKAYEDAAKDVVGRYL